MLRKNLWLNRSSSYFAKLVPVTAVIFLANLPDGASNFIKNVFLRVILMDFAKL